MQCRYREAPRSPGLCRSHPGLKPGVIRPDSAAEARAQPRLGPADIQSMTWKFREQDGSGGNAYCFTNQDKRQVLPIVIKKPSDYILSSGVSRCEDLSVSRQVQSGSTHLCSGAFGFGKACSRSIAQD